MSQIIVVTALRPETRAVLAALTRPRRIRPSPCPSWEGDAGANRVTVVQGGVGPEAARRAVRACGAAYDAVVSIGFAGALVPGLTPGNLVFADTVLWEEEGALRRHAVPEFWLRVALAALPPDLERTTTRGAIFSSPVALTAVAAKREAHQHYGAVAVEMEGAALAAHAVDCGVAFLALRAILDHEDLSLESLPRDIDTSWAARVRVAVMPRVWPLVVTLVRDAALAAATLTKASAAVLPALRGG